MTHLRKILNTKVTASLKSKLLSEFISILHSDELLKAFLEKWKPDEGTCEYITDGYPGESLEDSCKKYFQYIEKSFKSEFTTHAQEKGDKLMAWRAITSKDAAAYVAGLKAGKYMNDGAEFQGTGKFYTWYHRDDLYAPAGGRTGETLIIKAEVPFASIDMFETVLANADPVYADEEAELTLKEGAKLHVLDILNKKGVSLIGSDVPSLPAVAED